MITKYAIKNAFADKFLAEADETDKIFLKERNYAFHTCDGLHQIAIFDTKEEAMNAYAESFSNQLSEVGIIVEVLLKE